MELLLAIDLMNVVRRVYEANPAPDTVEKAQASLRASLGSLRRAVREHSPTHVVLALDAGGETWRHRLYASYKAQRKPMPLALEVELHGFVDELTVQGWPVLSLLDVEADDTLGSIAVTACEQQLPTVVLSTDKDLVHLAKFGARVYDQYAQVWRDEKWCQDKFGVQPSLLLDYLAMVGDPVDGIPGIPRVGAKTASKLLTQYGSLDGVLAAAHEIPGKIGECVRTSGELVSVSRQLTSLKLDLFEPGFNLRKFEVPAL